MLDPEAIMETLSTETRRADSSLWKSFCSLLGVSGHREKRYFIEDKCYIRLIVSFSFDWKVDTEGLRIRQKAGICSRVKFYLILFVLFDIFKVFTAYDKINTLCICDVQHIKNSMKVQFKSCHSQLTCSVLTWLRSKDQVLAKNSFNITIYQLLIDTLYDIYRIRNA